MSTTHTKGPWRPVRHDTLGTWIVVGERAADGLSDPIAFDMSAADAALIAEAGTVAHETGKTPRQLAEENRELLEALKESTVLVEASYLDLAQERGENNISTKHVFDEMQRYKAIIAKAEGKA